MFPMCCFVLLQAPVMPEVNITLELTLFSIRKEKHYVTKYHSTIAINYVLLFSTQFFIKRRRKGNSWL